MQPAAGTCPGEQDALGTAVDAPRQNTPKALKLLYQLITKSQL